MKAMILNEQKAADQNPLVLSDVPVPDPASEDILIRVKVCGVCHTDLHTVEGDLAFEKKPVIPGHQIVGEVERPGAAVTRFKAGERVGVTWLNSACQDCSYCRQGLENLCEHASFTGLHAHGGYAEYAVVPAEYAFSIPEGFPDEQAAPV